MTLPRRREVLVAGLALLHAAAAPAQADTGTAARVLNTARTMAAAGQAEPALRQLEQFLSAPRGASEPDLVVLRLEAARIAIAAGMPDRARPHLERGARLTTATVFRQEPLLTARLLRELARARAAIGDIASAESLLGRAVPMLSGVDPAAAAEALNARGILRLELLLLVTARGDFEQGLAQFARARGAPMELAVTLHANLALALAEAGDTEAGVEAAARARAAAVADLRLLRTADLAEGAVRLRALQMRQAEAVLERVAQEADTADATRGHALLALALARFDRGRMPEAAETAAAAVEAYRGTLGERHPAFGRALHILGTAQSELAANAAAAETLARAASVFRDALGPTSAQLQLAELERGWLALKGRDPRTAEDKARSALAAYALVPPPDRRPEGLANVLLGLAAEAEDRHTEAIGFFVRGQTLIETARGPDSPDLGFSLVRLGRLLTRLGRYGAAAAPLDRAIRVYERVGGAGTVRLAEALTARAELRARTDERRGALDDTRRALALLRERVTAAPDAISVAGEAEKRGARELFVAQATLLLRLDPGSSAAREDAFAASQLALTSRTGEAVRRAVARRIAGGGALAGPLKDRQEATEALLQADSLVFQTAARAGQDAGRDSARFRALRDEAASRLDVAIKALQAQDPAFAAFLAPKPAKLADVQTMLAGNEALIAPLVGESELLLWVVRSTGATALPVGLEAAALNALVKRLRDTLDLNTARQRGALLPYDTDAAQALGEALIGQPMASRLLDGVDHLLVVPDGALQQLPPQLLRYASDRWVVERFAVTIAPSIASVVAARSTAARPSRAPRAFLGIADPDFSGFADTSATALRGPTVKLRQSLSAQPRLPATAMEVQRLAAHFGAEESRILLGTEATERSVFDAGPGQYRVISFATHAIMAGELPDLSEPAILLTAGRDPPPFDGLLTASDVVSLELDADLVMLSACNTAAPDGGPYAEGLSGLARAFLQAGTRSLLVSHWHVSSTATTDLMTRFATLITASGWTTPNSGARALQQASLGMIRGNDARVHHPAFWSPFVIVSG